MTGGAPGDRQGAASSIQTVGKGPAAGSAAAGSDPLTGQKEEPQAMRG